MAEGKEPVRFVLVAHRVDRHGIMEDHAGVEKFIVTWHRVDERPLMIRGKKALGRKDVRYLPWLSGGRRQKYDVRVRNGQLEIVASVSNPRPTWIGNKVAMGAGMSGKAVLREGERACANLGSNQKAYVYIHALTGPQVGRLWDLTDNWTQDVPPHVLEKFFEEARMETPEKPHGTPPSGLDVGRVKTLPHGGLVSRFLHFLGLK
ncbi:hypothetical protein HYV43_00180 [Candidatus Micrarchaeota archaeon]|nr:hypothetical protein [Candidatus Micrarchaeota archaeon]